MKYLSLCSGIEAATVAWHPLGWEPIAFSEIEPFPCSLLKERWSGAPNIGDMTKIDGREYHGKIDLVVGGTPCQGFSIAGNRQGLGDERSGLAMHFVRIVSESFPRWFLWENVPGAFLTNGGRDFGTFIRALVECGYHLSWRVLDAQFFGVPQQRRRIFLVGHSRNWERPAKVLFESEGMYGDYSEGRKEGCQNRTKAKKVAGIDVSRTLITNGYKFNVGHDTIYPTEHGVRRFTPMEFERLQGFPDGYTDITYKGKPAPDTLRYKALGNSMAVPVMRWIGERIQQYDQ